MTMLQLDRKLIWEIKLGLLGNISGNKLVQTMLLNRASNLKLEIKKEKEYKLKFRMTSVENQKQVLLEEKCEVEGHEQYDLVAVCLDEDCKFDRRLACSKCLVFNHGKHTNSCIFLEDLKDTKQMETKSWSNDNLGKQVEQYLLQNENIEEKLDEMMDNLIETIIKETNKAKNCMRQKRVSGKTQAQKISKQIQQKYEAAYDIQNIKSILQDFVEQKIDEKQLNEKLEDVIKAREEIELLNRRNQIVANYPQINKEYLQEQYKSILDLIEQMSSAIRIPNSWMLKIPKLDDKLDNIKEIKQGQVYDFNSQEVSQTVIGSEPLTQGVHTWILKIEMLKNIDKGKQEDSDLDDYEKSSSEEEEEEEEKKEENEQNNNNNVQGGFGRPGQFGFGGFGNDFNHEDYKELRNLVVGICNEKTIEQNSKINLHGGDVQALDIIRGQIYGGLLIQSQTSTKAIQKAFSDQRNKGGLEVILTLDFDQERLTIKDINQDSCYEATIDTNGQSFRPYINSIRSKIRVSLVNTSSN
ncbi:hypothetical protein PPERSA_00937 [Pseudocohnilembus persalinus]|uniref:Uncharacterized protein n=1 Tax=Pseudocohnilembus persalinus TaxID=266149 RepID=A0A0V0QET1_PSEPJ|nr:hypothetical protein PPERSA_00937 [Pseudocohnilembus persalinus]|eukprot:KRX00710.1 hypothetical protein PPERSA_00937 [Pseudocohnilembus persalinus]